MRTCKTIGCGKQILSNQTFDFCQPCYTRNRENGSFEDVPVQYQISGVKHEPVMGCSTPLCDKDDEVREPTKPDLYQDISGLHLLDINRVLKLFKVTDPCIQFAARTLLHLELDNTSVPDQDIQAAIESLQRWQEMRNEDLMSQ